MCGSFTIWTFRVDLSVPKGLEALVDLKGLLLCQQNSPRLNKMPTTIRDSSLTTARRRQLALYAWRQANQFPQNPQSVRPEQGGSKGGPDSGPTATVPVNAYLGAQLIGQTTGGACACSPAVSLQGYDKKSPAC